MRSIGNAFFRFMAPRAPPKQCRGCEPDARLLARAKPSSLETESAVKFLRNILLSLAVGGLFAWAMATKMPVHAAALSGTAATAFMYGGFVFNDRIERRENQVRRTEDDDELS